MPESTPVRRPKPPRKSRLEAQLELMDARAPTREEVAAIRAMCRGTALPGQQRAATAYLLAELCGVGRVVFTKEQSYGTAFRAGSQAVGLAIAAIADAVLMRFPVGAGLEDEPPQGGEDNERGV